ncbi:bifunctional nuclease family protein [Bacteroidia bacterium]|jgi:bifunctional DNase/RNase|nr:bifunctional nuclease family protein [Bacteroidia bacterium]
MDEKIQLNIIGLTAGHSQRNSYTLILGEDEGVLKLPIVIGSYEAQSIALIIEGLSPQRPLTHDLMFETMTKFGIEITEVVIDNLKEGVFYAKLITVQNGIEHAIDSRTSDAVALALRAKCNIYTYKNILDDAGVEYENQDDELDEPSHIAEENVKPEEQNSLSTMTVHQLNNELEKAIQVEDYDRAALLRDVINTRK